MKRVEFTMLKRWANKKAEELHRGDPLLVDFRPIDESRGKSKTMNLPVSRLHTNVGNPNKEIVN